MIVTHKSENGFKVEKNNKWFQVDKFKLIKDNKFINLKVNDEIENIKKNNKEFVIDFDPVCPLGVASGKEVSISLNKSSLNLPPSSSFNSDRAREILKGQCLNIAFSDMNKLIEFKDERDSRIRIAQKLLNELEQADYYNW